MNEQDSHVEYYKAYKKALSELKNISAKYPKYIKHLVNIYMKNPFKEGFLEMTKSVYAKQVEYNQVFKNESFSLLNYKDIELIEDLMLSTVTIHKATKLARSLVSKKYHKLLSPEIDLLFRYFVEKNISKSKLQRLIGTKVARFKNSLDFQCFIKDVIVNIDQITMMDIEEKAEKLNTSVFSKADNKLILQIMDYKSSNELGSPSWCISYDERYWDQYNRSESIMALIGLAETRQYFIWDFNKKPYDNEFLIGVTISKNKVNAAHYKDDSPINTNRIAKEYSCLLKDKNVPYEELLNRIEKLEIKDFLKESMIDHINRLEEKKR